MIDVKHVAKLAKLRLDEDKIPMFESQMEAIVQMVEKLPDIQVESSLPDPKNAMILREDELQPSIKREDLLANAPQVQAGCIVVPKTV